MIWGYGNKNYGPYRVNEMLRTPDFQENLEMASSNMRLGKIGTAYNKFNLSMCGPTFVTKYLYFVGLGQTINPMPLILDSVMARFLEKTVKQLDKYVKVNRNKKGQITSLRRFSTGYLAYVNLLDDWAKDMKCRPDSIELFIFQSYRQKEQNGYDSI